MPFDGRVYEDRIVALEKIDRVIDLLASEDRWCKGLLQSSDGRRCILGAMQDADAVAVLRKPILQAIREVTGTSYRQIERFNDCGTTTHALVLQVLHQTRRNILSGELGSGVARPSAMASWRWRLKALVGQ
jgi:hypothetical protein